MQITSKRPLLQTLMFGCASIALYVLLFIYADQLVEFAYQTKTGNKLLFLIPVAIAFVCSYFHGAFTGYFWEAVGLRAAKTSSNKK